MRLEVIQSYPYDTIDARLVTRDIDGSAVGFNVGANFGWFFTRTLGVGALIRFTQATKKDVRIGSGEPFDRELGGFQGGGGGEGPADAKPASIWVSAGGSSQILTAVVRLRAEDGGRFGETST